MGQPPEALVRFAGDVDEIVKRVRIEGAPPVQALTRGPGALTNEMVVAPRDAFLGADEIVGLDDAIGRVSCESIAGYPPGIPALLPGERITAETAEYLRDLVASGARLHGAADPTLATIHVLAGT
jgi:lysine decarboxylase